MYLTIIKYNSHLDLALSLTFLKKRIMIFDNNRVQETNEINANVNGNNNVIVNINLTLNVIPENTDHIENNNDETTEEVNTDLFDEITTINVATAENTENTDDQESINHILVNNDNGINIDDYDNNVEHLAIENQEINKEQENIQQYHHYIDIDEEYNVDSELVL